MIEEESYDLWQEDAITLNPYLGTDGIAPFIKPCNEKDKGLFRCKGLMKGAIPSIDA